MNTYKLNLSYTYILINNLDSLDDLINLLSSIHYQSSSQHIYKTSPQPTSTSSPTPTTSNTNTNTNATNANPTSYNPIYDRSNTSLAIVIPPTDNSNSSNHNDPLQKSFVHVTSPISHSHRHTNNKSEYTYMQPLPQPLQQQQQQHNSNNR